MVKKKKVKEVKFKVNIPKMRFKVEKAEDYLIIWRKTPGASEWFKWQNIPAKCVKNFNNIKIKMK